MDVPRIFFVTCVADFPLRGIHQIEAWCSPAFPYLFWVLNGAQTKARSGSLQRYIGDGSVHCPCPFEEVIYEETCRAWLCTVRYHAAHPMLLYTGVRFCMPAVLTFLSILFGGDMLSAFCSNKPFNFTTPLCPSGRGLHQQSAADEVPAPLGRSAFRTRIRRDDTRGHCAPALLSGRSTPLLSVCLHLPSALHVSVIIFNIE